MREQTKIISFYARRAALMRGTVLCHTNQVLSHIFVSPACVFKPLLSCYNGIIPACRNVNFIVRSLLLPLTQNFQCEKNGEIFKIALLTVYTIELSNYTQELRIHLLRNYSEIYHITLSKRYIISCANIMLLHYHASLPFTDKGEPYWHDYRETMAVLGSKSRG